MVLMFVESKFTPDQIEFKIFNCFFGNSFSWLGWGNFCVWYLVFEDCQAFTRADLEVPPRNLILESKLRFQTQTTRTLAKHPFNLPPFFLHFNTNFCNLKL
jgi:hypothetical protein